MSNTLCLIFWDNFSPTYVHIKLLFATKSTNLIKARDDMEYENLRWQIRNLCIKINIAKAQSEGGVVLTQILIKFPLQNLKKMEKLLFTLRIVDYGAMGAFGGLMETKQLKFHNLRKMI